MKLPPVITRSARRRRVAFTIRPEDGRLEVLAPLRASAAEIERIIAHNPDLIERLRRQFEQVEARRTVPEFRAANSITSGRCIRSASPGRCWPSTGRS